MKPLQMLGCDHFPTGTDPEGNPICRMCQAEQRSAKFREQLTRINTEVSPQTLDPMVASVRGAGVTQATITGESDFQAGIYQLPDQEYHADPLKVFGTESLSNSWAKYLLPPYTPAHYRYRRDHPIPASEVMEFGSAVHSMLLGGASVVEIAADSWRGAAAKEQRDHIGAQGGIGLLSKDYAQAHQIVEAVKTHPVAKQCFSDGQAEQAMFVKDPTTGVWLRAKPDYTKTLSNGVLLITDLKTCRSADGESFSKTCGEYKYHRQAAWYEMVTKLLGLAERVLFLLVAVEKTAPYLVQVHQFKPEWVQRGHRINRAAINQFATCMASGQWPGYPNMVNQIMLPSWTEREEDFILAAEEDNND